LMRRVEQRAGHNGGGSGRERPELQPPRHWAQGLSRRAVRQLQAVRDPPRAGAKVLGCMHVVCK
jgi:hypothetical protein